MREDASEIKRVLEQHTYSITNIIVDVMKTFKLNSIIKKAGFEKQEGYRVSEILALMIMLPLMLLKSVHHFYKSEYQQVTEMRKDAIYRLKNNEKMPWRTILYGVAKQFQTLTNPQKVVAENSAFIIDDTSDARVGRRIENVSYIFDHVAGKKGSKLGFKDLMLGYFDGKSFIPLDFSIHSERALQGKQRKEQFKKQWLPKSSGEKRRQECTVDKITNSLAMIKRAVKHGIIAKYVLADSWFSSKEFIQTIRQIKNGAMHVVCGVRKDKRKYSYKGTKLNAKELQATLKQEGNEKRCRKRNTRYFEVVVQYEDVGDVKLYLCRFPYQKQWRLFLSTDTSLSFLAMMEIYATRWTIEVFFKEMKQHIRLGQCQSRDFDAQIAHVTTCCILYTFLAYFRRVNAYESLGGLFECIAGELMEKNLAQRLWDLFEDLLQVVIDAIAESGTVDMTQFKCSTEYGALKELFEESFLGNQLLQFNKTA
jgi:hypothetical protein